MLLDGAISHTGIQYMDLVEIFNFSLDLSSMFRFLVGVELPLCIIVSLSWNATTCFQESS